jgi:hypothetical protein
MSNSNPFLSNRMRVGSKEDERCEQTVQMYRGIPKNHNGWFESPLVKK